MTPDIVGRMSSAQIERALSQIASELETLKADQLVLMNELERRMSAMRGRVKECE